MIKKYTHPILENVQYFVLSSHYSKKSWIGFNIMFLIVYTAHCKIFYYLSLKYNICWVLGRLIFFCNSFSGSKCLAPQNWFSHWTALNHNIFDISYFSSFMAWWTTYYKKFNHYAVSQVWPFIICSTNNLGTDSSHTHDIQNWGVEVVMHKISLSLAVLVLVLQKCKTKM